MSVTTPPPSPALVRRASVAGFLGTVVESYDFFVYTYLIVYTAPLFFPNDDPVVAVLSSLLVLGAGFVARPLGGLFFGRLGDRRGRRFTLLVTILTMGAATCLMGLLPTYASIGFLAPLLLVVFRLVQGFAAGGEQAGSTTFISEHADRTNHGLLSAITPLGFSVGTVLAPGVVALFAVLLGESVMGDWGWRLPMLLSLPLTAVCLLLRVGVEDSPEFKRLAAAQEVTKTPVQELFTQYWRPLLKVTVLSASVLMVGYIVAAFIPLFLQREAGFAPGSTAAMASMSGIGSIAFTIFAGLVMDRVGRRPVLFFIMGAIGALFFPVLFLMQANDGNFLVAMLGLTLLGGLGGAAGAPVYASLTAVFPVRVRYSGAALGFGLGSALGGGAGPWLAAQLTETTGNIYAPAYLAMAAVLLGMAVMSTLPSRGVANDDGRVSDTAPEGSAAGSAEADPLSVT